MKEKELMSSEAPVASERFFENRACKYFPCHDTTDLKGFNCLFCYCPMHKIKHCPGNPAWIETEMGKIKDCSRCSYPHNPENYDKIMQVLRNNMYESGKL